MGLRLEVISKQRQKLRNAAIRDFGPDGGTIGRSLQADWSLPDGDRVLSNRHASIDFRSGSYYIVDTSTNGVYVNDSTDPVGRGNPQRLFSGDIVRIGSYRLRVDIDDTAASEFLASDHIDPVDAAQRVDSPDLTGIDLIEAHQITGVGFDFELDGEEVDTLTPLSYSFKVEDLDVDDLQVDASADDDEDGDDEPAAAPAAAKPTKAKTAPAKAAPAAKSRPTESKPPEKAPAKAGPATKTDASAQPSKKPKAPAKSAGRNRSASGAPAADAGAPGSVGALSFESRMLAAFCKGAGIDTPEYTGKTAEEAMFRLGETFQAMLDGIVESLRLRSAQRTELRQENTVIQPAANNIIKFSASAREALDRILDPKGKEYMDPIDSIRDALDDLNAHQRAMLKALPDVVNQYIEMFDPANLEAQFANSGRNRLLGAANKVRYWDLYKDVYLVMCGEGGEGLPEAFADLMAEAYKREVETTRAKREASRMAESIG